ncbi:hypothetical protein J31TS4_01920 [Paenibacillus sp. J31TS4]|nr:hypothetical protein [Paenibacillus sp. J31TS4]GIP36912.1 hypothetical protein J31TS4_01920 [Paenibacillus sp. J31TS4]
MRLEKVEEGLEAARTYPRLASDGSGKIAFIQQIPLAGLPACYY